MAFINGFGQMVDGQPQAERDQEGVELDAGWRILAVCPQPDQRRPDYILGRTKPT